MIRIVDYGLGNILAFQNMYKRMNIEARVARSAGDFEGATRIVLPGVGAFDEAMGLLDRSGMLPRLTELVRDRRMPTIGVCVGMQMLAQSSDEGLKPGLGWIDGEVKHFSVLGGSTLPVPHMGWNDVVPGVAGQRLFAGLEDEARFYFLHSFFVRCQRNEEVAATSVYGMEFACAVHSGNIYGVQFHPEKSHHFGARLLKNFAEI